MARVKRGDEVPPPAAGDEWTIRYATKEALAFEELARQFPGNCEEAKARLKHAPDERREGQKPLKGVLASRLIGGADLPQWQYDISSSARLWYCVDDVARIVWLTLASAAHPKATAARSKGAQRRS